MKRRLIMIMLYLVMFALSVLLTAGNDHGNVDYIGFGGSDLKIVAVKTVKEVKTRDGVIEVENRNSRLVEVKLAGRVPKPGLAILTPSGFSAVFKYRRLYRSVAARGGGVKPKVAPGKIIDVLVSAPDANVNIDSSKTGEKEEIYLYFEIPKEVSQFKVQVPLVVPGAAQVR